MTNELPSWMTEGAVTTSKPAPQETTDRPEKSFSDVQKDTTGIEASHLLDKLSVVRSTMVRDVRSWGKWLIVLGVIHLAASGFLDASWGVLLIVVGGASFLFQTPAMYIIYAITLAWAGLSNLLGGGWAWGAFAILQFYFVFRILRQYFSMRKVGLVADERHSAYSDDPQKPLAPRLFPWLGVIGGALISFSLVVLFGTIILMAIIFSETETFPWENAFEFLLSLILSLAVMLTGVNLAALLGGYRPRFLAWLGLAFSVVPLLIILAFSFL